MRVRISSVHENGADVVLAMGDRTRHGRIKRRTTVGKTDITVVEVQGSPDLRLVNVPESPEEMTDNQDGFEHIPKM